VVRVKVIRERVWEAPALVLSDNEKDRLGKLLLGGIMQNIKQQEQADGSPLKRNAPGTEKRKRNAGKPALSLVDEEHRFVKPGNWARTWSTDGSQVVVIEPLDVGGPPTLKELVRDLQVAGYTGWFGASKETVAAAVQLMRDWLRRAIRRG
jgi:hypothetical protein